LTAKGGTLDCKAICFPLTQEETNMKFRTIALATVFALLSSTFALAQAGGGAGGGAGGASGSAGATNGGAAAASGTRGSAATMGANDTMHQGTTGRTKGVTNTNPGSMNDGTANTSGMNSTGSDKMSK
jgi:hypothetical protein